MPNQDQATTVPSEIAEQLKQIPERPRTEFETAMFNAEKQRLMDVVGNLEAAVKERAPQTIEEAIDMCSHPMPSHLRLEPKAKLPSASELLSTKAWSLKCLTDDVRGLTKVLYGEQRANATLALRHLEDALHRMELAKTPSTEANC